MVDFLRLRYIVVMHNKRTCNYVCKFLTDCTGFLQDFRGAIAESLKISTVSSIFIPFIMYSCIDIYAHSCLKQFSIGRKPCSNSKTHVQIMKFTCRLNMGFGRPHWSMRRDVMCFVLNKMADVEEAPRFSVSFYVVKMLFSRYFKWVREKMQE